MDLQLRGKRVLITGGSKGIGRAAAMSLAAEGCDIVLAARDPATLAQAAEMVRSRHQVRVETVSADLSQAAEAVRLAGAAGEIDVLVNNAGAIPPGTLLQVDDAKWRAAWDLKVFGFINLTRAVYPTLKSRGGVVVNVIGAAGESFDPNYITGSAGNASLMAFTRALGRAAPADGMRVVGINPGPVATERMEMLMRARAERELGDPARWAELTKPMPFGRAATPEEIGDAVAFLASPRSGYTTGTILTINGG
ncbi:SDR family oxidoreductase [Acidisphaera sp. L21]|uniref:SDR family oxidoreductase n=1 Tax=Acidisphaera sp. L21 TaxID=1641851 RepID=UPI00131DFB78|nr:SDR family oxidoreductase [Acidisphaera sp. L21]